MTKSISCKDAGAKCTWSTTAATEKELLKKVEEHVKAKHKDLKITPELIAKVKSIIKDI